MRISDWSSDVCSSDLQNGVIGDVFGDGLALVDAIHIDVQVEIVLQDASIIADLGHDGIANHNAMAFIDADHVVDLDNLLGNLGHQLLPAPMGRLISCGGQMTLFRSDAHTSELQSLMRISFAVFS